MATFSGSDFDNYTKNSKGSYFSLKDDGDTGHVRFLYENAEDIQGMSVHKVKVGDRDRYVNCLREYNSPIDECPFCREGFKLQAKLFVPLYNEDTDSIQIWERGKKFYSKLTLLISRYGPLVSHTWDIVRNGKAGSTDTTYEVIETGKDDCTLEDFDEVPNVLGTIVLDKTAQDMEDYLEVGSFPEESTSTPIQRRGSARTERTESQEETPRRGSRRTPARGSGDRF